MTTPSRPYYPPLGRHVTLGTPQRLEPAGLGSPQRVSPSRSNQRVVIQPPPATPRAAINVNKLGSNRRSRAALSSGVSVEQKVTNQMNTLQELIENDKSVRPGYNTMSRDIPRDIPRDSTMHDGSRAPSSEFKFRSNMPLDMPPGGYRSGYEENEDDTITKRRRVASHVSSTSSGSNYAGRTKNVTWEEDARDDGLHRMIVQLVAQNQRMEEKLSRFERLGEQLERMERVESRLMRVESKMDEILRRCN